MVNQDEVALKLMRTTIAEMHALLWDRGMCNRDTWFEYAISPETHKFLLSHGWTLAEYSKECIRDFNTLHKYYYMIRWFNCT